MDDLERLTQVLGGRRKTAAALKITTRTYWSYKKANLPEAKREHIALLPKARSKRQRRKAAANG